MTPKGTRTIWLLVALASFGAIGVVLQRTTARDKPPVAISVILGTGVVLALIAGYGLSQARSWGRTVGLIAASVVALIAVGGLLQSTIPTANKIGIGGVLTLASVTLLALLKVPTRHYSRPASQ